jgi:murein DD-endopeptidase MepM/ murein hydrolase activator NlpD
MIASNNKRAVVLLALGLALPASGFAAASQPGRTLGDAAGGPQEARRPLDPRAAGPAAIFPVKGAGSFGEGAARFGAARSGHMHEGQDVFAPEGTPLVAVRDGIVLETGDDGGRGNFVSFYSPAERQTYVYMHMSEPSRVAAGRHVKAGERVGSVGCTGSCFGDHLHFEVRRGRGTQAPPVDPLPLLMRLKRSG